MLHVLFLFAMVSITACFVKFINFSCFLLKPTATNNALYGEKNVWENNCDSADTETSIEMEDQQLPDYLHY